MLSNSTLGGGLFGWNYFTHHYAFNILISPMKTQNIKLYTSEQSVFVVVLQVVIFLTAFFMTTTTFAKEKEALKEIRSSEKTEIVSEENAEKEITPIIHVVVFSYFYIAVNCIDNPKALASKAKFESLISSPFSIREI